MNNILKGTNYDYSTGIAEVPVPVVSHENGQYQMYPDYREIENLLELPVLIILKLIAND